MILTESRVGADFRHVAAGVELAVADVAGQAVAGDPLQVALQLHIAAGDTQTVLYAPRLMARLAREEVEAKDRGAPADGPWVGEVN
jgi:hypothetical protein